MSSLKIDTDLKYLNHLSNAVLAPHLIHPNFWESANPNVGRSDYAVKPAPLKNKEIKDRQRWCKAQIIALEKNPSTAVLKGD